MSSLAPAFRKESIWINKNGVTFHQVSFHVQDRNRHKLQHAPPYRTVPVLPVCTYARFGPTKAGACPTGLDWRELGPERGPMTSLPSR